MSSETIAQIIGGLGIILGAIKIPDIVKYFKEKNAGDLKSLMSKISQLKAENEELKKDIARLEKSELITQQTLKVLIPIIKSKISEDPELLDMMKALELVQYDN